MRSRESRLTRLGPWKTRSIRRPPGSGPRACARCSRRRRCCPRAIPWTTAALEEDDTGMGRLLREARQWQQERGA